MNKGRGINNDLNCLSHGCVLCNAVAWVIEVTTSVLKEGNEWKQVSSRRGKEEEWSTPVSERHEIVVIVNE